ncbi:S-phase kinase-associated protein 2 [Phlebotomus argentipes]|uniref:S-phase kinase-associated protein 2 n=1 Tax=Phlebotomus argentipes TaxID=94469 RepID=UPI002893072D|nr:S-phase kinase-associated protein 2 [Phlebotomus argentipes]
MHSIKTAYQMISDENFYLYKVRESSEYDHFSTLSDEMILHVFKWLPKKTLMKCSLVNRRFLRLTQDETLWARMDLAGRSLRPEAVGRVITRGVIILRLAQTKIIDPIFEPDFFIRFDQFESKLQYLDLSMASVTVASLHQLLKTCRQLRKLSLEHLQLSDRVCEEIAQNTNLEVLNLALCSGVRSRGLRSLLTRLNRLQSLNISWTNLETESVAILVETMSLTILRLNIAGCRKTLTDEHLSTLVDRCPNIRELDVSDCNLLTVEVVRILNGLRELEYLSLSRCYNISVYALMDFQFMPSLNYLDIFGMLSDNQLKVIINSLSSIGINKFINSAVARPTVGTRRTSIWGLRTRD